MHALYINKISSSLRSYIDIRNIMIMTTLFSPYYVGEVGDSGFPGLRGPAGFDGVPGVYGTQGAKGFPGLTIIGPPGR